MKKNDIHISISLDHKFLVQALTMLESLLKNKAQNNLITIHVLDSGLKPVSRLILKSYLKRNFYAFKIYKIKFEKIENAPISKHITIATYSRVFLSSIIDENIDRILYIDCDVIINSDISELYHEDLSNFPIGACNEIIEFEDKKRLGLNLTDSYFNAGILLLNLKKWREENIEIDMLDFINNFPEKIKYWDQDVLNYCFKNNWKKLDPKYNVTHFYFYKDVYSPEYFGISHDDYSEIISNPKIIHFTSHKKPWIEGCDHPLAYLYFKNELSLKKLIIDILLCRKR